MDPPVYDEHSEMAARAEDEEPVINPEEQEYLALLQDLEYGGFAVHHLYFILNPDLSSQQMEISPNMMKRLAVFSLTLFILDSQRRSLGCSPLCIQMLLRVSSLQSTQSVHVPRHSVALNQNITTAASSLMFVTLGYTPHSIPVRNARNLVSMELIPTESLAPATSSPTSPSSRGYVITSPTYPWLKLCNIVETTHTFLGFSRISSMERTIRPSVKLQSQLTTPHSSQAQHTFEIHETLLLAYPLMVLEYSVMVRLQLGPSSYSTITFLWRLDSTSTTSFPLASFLDQTNLQSQTHS